jgi:hypothetical protein
MPDNHDPIDTKTLAKSTKWRPSRATRNVLMVIVGFIALVITAGVVFYQPIRYGDAVENFGIVMVLTVPVIAAVAFRVGLDSWLELE